MARRLLEMSVLALVACAKAVAPGPATSSAAAPPVAAVPAPAAVVEVRVTHSRPDHLHVEYTFPEATSEIVFARPSPTVRTNWAPATPGVKLFPDHATAPSAMREWTFDLVVDEIQPEKDYRNFYRFTDRGLLFYTGHLAARSVTQPRESTRGELTFVSAPDERIVARGQPRDTQAKLPMNADGTYVYFGTLTPSETSDFVGVVDQGFPPALRARIDEVLPRFFAFFSNGLGRPESAEEKPLLFATYHERTGRGWDMGGGVMPPRVVNFDFGIAKQPSAEARVEIEKILAHEIAHLWNADLYSGEDELHETWMKEGSADALAARALLEAKAINQSDYRWRFSDALNLCLLALDEGEPLSASRRPGRSRDYYTCGMTLTALSAAASKMELIPFLREVYSGPNNTYDGARWFATIEARGGKADVVRKLAAERLGDPSVELSAALKDAGIAHTLAQAPSEFVQVRAAPFAVRALLAPSCVAALDMYGTMMVRPEVTADGACGPATKGDELTTLAGVDLATHALGAHDQGFAQCQARKTVTVGRRGKSDIEIPCAPKPRRRTPYYEIMKVPY